MPPAVAGGHGKEKPTLTNVTGHHHLLLRGVLLLLTALLAPGLLSAARHEPAPGRPPEPPGAQVAATTDHTDTNPASPPAVTPTSPERRMLPAPAPKGRMSLEETLAARRSVRLFADKPLTLEQIAQLCWAAQGITEPQRGLRTAPSAGAKYPMELYVVSAEGVDHYVPASHAFERHLPGDLRPALQQAAYSQECIRQAPACFVVAADVQRTASKYGDRAERYCFIEAGHIGQNVLLQATASDLAGVPVGAYDDDAVAAKLRLPANLRVLYLLPIGHPQG